MTRSMPFATWNDEKLERELAFAEKAATVKDEATIEWWQDLIDEYVSRKPVAA